MHRVRQRLGRPCVGERAEFLCEQHQPLKRVVRIPDRIVDECLRRGRDRERAEILRVHALSVLEVARVAVAVRIQQVPLDRVAPVHLRDGLRIAHILEENVVQQVQPVAAHAVFAVHPARLGEDEVPSLLRDGVVREECLVRRCLVGREHIAASEVAVRDPQLEVVQIVRGVLGPLEGAERLHDVETALVGVRGHGRDPGEILEGITVFSGEIDRGCGGAAGSCDEQERPVVLREVAADPRGVVGKSEPVYVDVVRARLGGLLRQ